MAWDKVKGAWKELRGSVRERWSKLTDDDVEMIAGERDKLVGALQRRYGIARDQVEAEIRLFERKVSDTMHSLAEKASDARKPDGLARPDGIASAEGHFMRPPKCVS